MGKRDSSEFESDSPLKTRQKPATQSLIPEKLTSLTLALLGYNKEVTSLVYLLSFFNFSAEAKFNFSAGEKFQIQGWIDCKPRDCSLVIARGTRSETRLQLLSQLTEASLSVRKMNGQFVSLEVKVKDPKTLDAEALKTPVRTLQTSDQEAVRCLKP